MPLPLPAHQKKCPPQTRLRAAHGWSWHLYTSEGGSCRSSIRHGHWWRLGQCVANSGASAMRRRARPGSAKNASRLITGITATREPCSPARRPTTQHSAEYACHRTVASLIVSRFLDYCSGMEPSFGGAGGASRHEAWGKKRFFGTAAEASIKTKVLLVRPTKH